MSYINYPKKYPTILKYKEAQNTFNEKLSTYLALEDKYNKLVESQITQSNWIQVPGNLKNIVATGDSNVWGYNSTGDVFTCKKPCTDGAWTKTDGKITDIAGDKNTIYGIGTNKDIYHKPQDNSEDWYKLGSKKQFDKITTNNSDLLVGLTNKINVKMRITLQTSGGHNTYKNKSIMKLTNIMLINGNETVYNGSGKNMVINHTAHSIIFDFDTSTTNITNISVGINNTIEKVKHAPISFHFYNPFSPDKVTYAKLSNMKIEIINDQGVYNVIYNSKLNILTKQGHANHTISLGNGLNIGYLMHQCIKPCIDENWQPIKTDKPIINISADENFIYSVDKENILWRCSGDCSEGSYWEKDSIGAATKVDASGPKALRIVGVDNMLWERPKDKWGKQWTPTNKIVSNMSMSTTISPLLEDEDIEGKLWTLKPNDTIETAIRPPYQKWRDQPNRNSTVGLENVNKTSTSEWDYLGDFNSYDGCKFASLNAKNPFNKITYFNSEYNNPNLKKTCWGNKVGKAFKNKVDSNVITSYPPYGYTQLGGIKGIIILGQMKVLNKELINRAIELKNLTIPSNTVAQQMIKQKTAVSEKMKILVQNLEKDRQNITKLEKGAQVIIAEKESSSLLLTQKQTSYIGLGLLMVIMLFITTKNV